MIKDFHISDLGYFIPNEYSNPDNVLDVLVDASVSKRTVWHDGMVAAIIVYREYHLRCWQGFLLVADGMPIAVAKKIKRYLHDTIKRHDAMRFQTDSIDTNALYRWHRFLGFRFEGVREKMMHGKDYCMWAIIRKGGA